MPRPEKTSAVKEIKDKIEESKVVILSDYAGMTVKEMTELRARLRKEKTSYKVVKNTLALRALNEEAKEKFAVHLTGPVAVAFGADDPVSPAKVMAKFIKEFSKPVIKAGIVEGKFLTNSEVTALAKLPSREELVAKAVGGIKSPLYGLVNVLSGPIRKLVYVLDAIKTKK